MASFWRYLKRIATLRGSLLVGTGLGALALLAFSAHYVRRGYEQCHPRRTAIRPEDEDRARRLLPNLRELSVLTAEGLALRAWYVEPRNGSLMVLVTGLGGNRANLLDEAGLLARHGYGSLLLDARAHGDSEGTTATWGYLEADDVVRAVKLAYAQPGVQQVGALGFSVGASAVSLAAAREPSIRAVILYATWTSLREEIAYKMGKRGRLATFWVREGYALSGVDIDAVRPEPLLKSIAPRPIFLLSGGVDTDTPAWVMQRVFAACAEPKQLWHLPAVGHGGYLQAEPAEYERRIIAFLDQALATSIAH